MTLLVVRHQTVHKQPGEAKFDNDSVCHNFKIALYAVGGAVWRCAKDSQRKVY